MHGFTSRVGQESPCPTLPFITERKGPESRSPGTIAPSAPISAAPPEGHGALREAGSVKPATTWTHRSGGAAGCAEPCHLVRALYCSTHAGIQPEAYDPIPDVDFTRFRDHDLRTEGFGATV